jgi:hypothetical protein
VHSLSIQVSARLNELTDLGNSCEDALEFVKDKVLERNHMPLPVYIHITTAINSERMRLVLQAAQDVMTYSMLAVA